MGDRGYYREEALYFSALYGGAVYQRTGETEELLCDRTHRGAGRSPVLTNLTTGERVYLRRIDLRLDDRRSACMRRILSPPSRELALWPVDLIPLSARQREECTLFADHRYAPPTGEQRHGRYGAAFPLSDPPRLRDGWEELRRTGTLSWKNESVQHLAVRLADALDRLNREGYYYHDLHPSRLFFREDGRIFFDFSPLACGRGEGPMEHEIYPPEFADPAVALGSVPAADVQSQNYSLCACLFYLFFGRYAYDGPLLAGYPDDGAYNHYVKFRDYQRMPLFIFDPGDNALGGFDEDLPVMESWRECPAELRRRFTRTLSRPNAVRERTPRNAPPAEWLDCFRRLGWTK